MTDNLNVEAAVEEPKRKLVTLRTIAAIHPIEGADLIEEVTVDGWSLVAQKGIHKEGDAVLFFEIDSFLPEEDKRFDSFQKFGQNNFEGKRGHRVKTKRMKGVYSQGVIMPPTLFPELPEVIEPDVCYAELLGVVKYEKICADGFGGEIKSQFPYFLRKSAQERIQNVFDKLKRDHLEEVFVPTIKLHGQSCTVFLTDIGCEEGQEYRLGICSRNMELKCDFSIDYEEQGNFMKGALNSGLFEKLVDIHHKTGKFVAIQGELVGGKICGGYEKFEDYQVFAYNIFDITQSAFLCYYDFFAITQKFDINIVPELRVEGDRSTTVFDKYTLKDLLKMAEGKGIKCKHREGLVFKSAFGTKQFKVISNKFLNSTDE